MNKLINISFSKHWRYQQIIIRTFYSRMNKLNFPKNLLTEARIRHFLWEWPIHSAYYCLFKTRFALSLCILALLLFLITRDPTFWFISVEFVHLVIDACGILFWLIFSTFSLFSFSNKPIFSTFGTPWILFDLIAHANCSESYQLFVKVCFKLCKITLQILRHSRNITFMLY